MSGERSNIGAIPTELQCHHALKVRRCGVTPSRARVFPGRARATDRTELPYAANDQACEVPAVPLHVDPESLIMIELDKLHCASS